MIAPVKILKFWHQWGWAFHLVVWLVAGTLFVSTIQYASADNSGKIAMLLKMHSDENMATRMAVQEQNAKNIDDRLERMEVVQGKIFDRINNLADRPH